MQRYLTAALPIGNLVDTEADIEVVKTAAK